MRVMLLAALAAVLTLAQDKPTDLTQWLNSRAQTLLAQRRQTIAKIRTPAEVRARQAEVRQKLLALLHGLPDYSGPLNARTTSTIDAGTHLIEKVIFESLPRFPVTGNLYRPKAAGKHPAVLFSMGHWNEGKPAAQTMAANLARKGFVVLAYDPIGQGERLQFYDARLGEALPGGSVNQHFTAGIEAVLAGDNFARYMIFDSKRAIDYLASRPEVDAARIGATGCSGGGTQTTFVAALDDRIKVAAPACYNQSFELLFNGSIGDSEQSWPGFLAAGLDQTDFLELFAPKPWLISSTEGDFFTPAAAKIVYDEAKGWYRRLDAEERVAWVVGPGPHGTPLVVREAIYAWFTKWLKAGEGNSKEERVTLYPDHALWATQTGQVAVDLKARGIEEIIRENWQKKRDGASLRKPGPLTNKREKPKVRLMRESTSGSVTIQHLLLETEPGMEIGATLYEPAGAGQKIGILMVEPAARALDVAQQGHVVLAVWPRGTPGPKSDNWNRYFGDWAAATRSWLVGLSLPEMRALDLHRAIDLLALRKDVSEVRAMASGIAGLWLLRASMRYDLVVKKIWLDRTPYGECDAIGLSLHHDLHEAAHPGLCTDWDWVFFRDARVMWSDPTDWMRRVKPNLGTQYYYRHFEEGDSALWKEFLRTQ